ncbi:hypothetical protein ILUMI_06446 [Ignelater luminosus]|uniref:Uncharacterized protein n=1 Tax=Ignelater luminosus TaxID=2038154 RepID=A0A8K0D587_IGNLU|nr:hypothetical protein ILUMI_06446 [Ignelater luminosus]
MHSQLVPEASAPLPYKDSRSDSLGELLPEQFQLTNSPYLRNNTQELSFLTPETENINRTLRTYFYQPLNVPSKAPTGTEAKSARSTMAIYFPIRGNQSSGGPVLLNAPNSPFRPVRHDIPARRYCLIFWCIFTFVILCVLIATLVHF